MDGPNSSTRRSATCSTTESTYVKDLLAELRDEGREALVHTYHDGETIYREGDEGNALYVVQSGVVQLTRAHSGGKHATVGLVAAGETFGDLAFASGTHQHASAEALTDAAVLKIPRVFVARLVRHRPAAALTVLDLQALQVEREREMAGCLLPRHIEDRVARSRSATPTSPR